MANKMVELATQQPFFLGVKSARYSELGITVFYWQSLDAIAQRKVERQHLFEMLGA